jgi:hypothetical protein
MGEVSFGRRQRELTGERTTFLASYHELWITIVNGISTRLKYDLGDRDLGDDIGLEHRLSATLDVSPYPGLTFIAQSRVLFAEERSNPEADLFLHVHLWF